MSIHDHGKIQAIIETEIFEKVIKCHKMSARERNYKQYHVNIHITSSKFTSHWMKYIPREFINQSVQKRCSG